MDNKWNIKRNQIKYKLYKILIQTDTNNTVLYERLKIKFKEYRACLRKT